MTELAGWENFYVIVGSAAGALIGLQFVVITLIAERPIPDMARATSAFGTPSIVHFGTVLLLLYEQSLVRADDLSQVKRAFDLNGYVGILYFLVLAVSMYVG